MIRACIVGAGGYGGCGAVEILSRHPEVEIVALIDKENIGMKISDIYPHLNGFCDLAIISADSKEIEDIEADVVFFATPDRVGQKEASKWLQKGAKVIDYSGDFRFNSLDIYFGYAERIGADKSHASPELLKEAVYGLPELHRSEIANARIVGNPGCFAVSCILGLAPLVKAGLIKPDTVICDAKTGVSGAGKKPNPMFHYPARYDSMNAYKIASHQHVYEIEKELSSLAGKDVKITFTPHVVPMCRGILSTIYADPVSKIDIKEVMEAYKDFYKGERFVRVFDPGTILQTAHVRGTNFCNISPNMDKRTGKIIIISVIDNLVKGQAGNAVQNMNIMFGLDESLGLNTPGMYP